MHTRPRTASQPRSHAVRLRRRPCPCLSCSHATVHKVELTVCSAPARVHLHGCPRPTHRENEEK
jgi:hypothetical protein